MFCNHIQLLKPIDLQDQDILVSFDVVSLFTNVPIEESLQIIKTKLDTDQEKIQHFQPENRSDNGNIGSLYENYVLSS
jgi:hypothetical protein